MKINFIIVVASTIFFTACHSKKIIVYANSNVAIDENAKTITQKDDEGHVDKEMKLKSGGKVELKVQQKDGSSRNIEIPEDGYYIVNVKAKDTVVGGFQKYSTQQEANRIITQEELKRSIDSLQQMIEGRNTSAANRTFFIPPNTAAKISSNTDATVIGPYHRMTSMEQQGNKEPEVYRFYSVKEIRETIDKLMQHTGEKPGEEEKQKKENKE
jgi:hypothetical protein